MPEVLSERLDRALEGASGLRFLCSGNMVRSAFAELYARHLACPLPVDSAGTVFENPRLYPRARQALLSRGVAGALVDRFRPRHIAALAGAPDPRLVVFGMTRDHVEAWRAHRPEHDSAFLLLELLGREAEISDPVLDGASFDATFDTIAGCVEGLVGRLQARRARAAAQEGT